MSEIQERYMHKANFLPVSNMFEAFFNAIIPGRYDFIGTPACQNVQVLNLQMGYIYWIRKMSVGGNIPQEDYLGSIVDFPFLTIRTISRPNMAIYSTPIPIDKFVNSGDCEAWFLSDQSNDILTMSLSGSCIQLPAMIGVLSIKLNITLNIYSICDTSFSADFRGNA